MRRGEFYALQGVDLELQRGEALAVLGENGAGKSTLLKTLAGMLLPASGAVEVRGRIEAVIELGAGLNPVLTGRESVELSALLRGLPPDEGAQYASRVEAFADLGEAFDAPVGSYSSGMLARLAFALAAMAEPDILLVDEALSVGDLAFQRKCVRHIEGFLASGGALVLASHNLVQVQNLCSRAILLDEGRSRFTGAATETVRALVERIPPDAESLLDGPCSLRLVSFGDEHGDARTGATVDVVVEYELERDADGVMWGFELWTADQQQCVTTAQDVRARMLRAGRGTLRCRINRLPIAPGTYTLRLNIVDRGTGTPIALVGFGGPAPRVTIDSPPSIESNYQVETGQLAVVEVNWT